MKIQEELEQLTKLSRKQSESSQQYFTRLVEIVDSAIGDDDLKFNKLSIQTQKWLNKATSAYNNSSDIPNFTDEQPEESGISSSVNLTAMPVQQVVTSVQQEESHKENIPVKDTKERKSKSATSLIKELVCLHRDWTLEQVKNSLVVNPVKCSESTLVFAYSDMHSTLKILERLGMLK